jgi:hypothetical protein
MLQVIKCKYIKHTQGLCHFRLRTADHALSLVAPVTTAVQSLERSYAWPPPSLSHLYFLCRGSSCPMLRTFAFWWFWMTSACCLHNFLIYNHICTEVWKQSQNQRQSYFTTGGLPPISSFWRQAPWDPWPEIFFSNWTLAVIVLM